MKVKFDVEYDTDTRQFYINEQSSNVEIKHSGSSYLRVYGDMEGTISNRIDYDDIEDKCSKLMASQGWKILVIALKNKE